MNNIAKLKVNTVTTLFHQIAVIISGLILPRLILVHFGSETNGLVSSIGQFLSFISFLDLGVGAVIQSALYPSLAKNDDKQVSYVLKSAKNYFNKIAYFIIFYVLILSLSYPVLINQNVDQISTALLILSMSLGIFARYYFGIVNELLLNADQKSYVQLMSEAITVVLNLLICIFLLNQGYSIQIVKLGSGLIYLVRPLFLNYYVKKNYNLNYEIVLHDEPIKQKWHGMAQHIAYTIQNSTDIVILTLFSSLENISIYSIYNMIIANLKVLLISLINNIQSFIGNLIAKGETYRLNNYLTMIEWIVHSATVFIFGMTASLIDSFVLLYTSGVNDVDYYSPIFSLLLVLANWIYVVRQPYQLVVLAAGHFKQTQMSSIIEASINVVLSILLVNKFGLIGVAVSTFLAMVYRTIYIIIYLSKNIVYREIRLFLKHIFIDVVQLIFIISIGKIMSNLFPINNIIDWIELAVLHSIISLFFMILINQIFYCKTMIYSIKGIFKR